MKLLKFFLISLLPILVVVYAVFLYNQKEIKRLQELNRYSQAIFISHQNEFITVFVNAEDQQIIALLSQINATEKDHKIYLLRKINDIWYLYDSKEVKKISTSTYNRLDTILKKDGIINLKTNKINDIISESRPVYLVTIPIEIKDRSRVTDYLLVTSKNE